MIGKRFPPLLPMGTGFSPPNGQNRIEQQHALPGPACQISRDCLGRFEIEIGSELLQDISERGWRRHSCRYREGQAVCLPGSVIRILAQDDDTCFGERSQLERAEYLVRSGIHRLVFSFVRHVLAELFKRGTGEKIFQLNVPIGFAGPQVGERHGSPVKVLASGRVEIGGNRPSEVRRCAVLETR